MSDQWLKSHEEQRHKNSKLITDKLVDLIYEELKIPYQPSECDHHFLYKETIFSLNFVRTREEKPEELDYFWVDKLVPCYPESVGSFFVRKSMNFYLADPNCFKQAASWIKRHVSRKTGATAGD